MLRPHLLRSLSLARAAALALLAAALPACGTEFRIADQGTTGVGGGDTSTGTTTSTSSASAGGDTTSSSTVGTGGGTSTSSGPQKPEDCLDGVDDDGNGLVDCADPACTAGFECADPAPQGWEGYYRVQTSPWPGAAATPCGDGSTPQTLFAGPAGSAQCSACTCGEMKGGACKPPVIYCYPGSNNCNGNGANPQDWTPAVQLADCAKPAGLLGGNFALSCGIAKASETLTKGSCDSAGGGEVINAPWSERVDVCANTAAVGGGCGAAQVCVPRGDPGQSLCVRAEGKQTCPGGWTKVVQAFSGGSDERACSACGCDTTSVTCENGGYTFNDLDMCTMMPGQDPSIPLKLLSCTDVSVLLDGGTWSISVTPPQPGGTCAPTGGEPSGEVKPEGEVTFCCK